MKPVDNFYIMIRLRYACDIFKEHVIILVAVFVLATYNTIVLRKKRERILMPQSEIPEDVLVILKEAKEFAEKLEIRPYNEVHKTLQAAVDKTTAKIERSLINAKSQISGSRGAPLAGFGTASQGLNLLIFNL